MTMLYCIVYFYHVFSWLQMFQKGGENMKKSLLVVLTSAACSLYLKYIIFEKNYIFRRWKFKLSNLYNPRETAAEKIVSFGNHTSPEIVRDRLTNYEIVIAHFDEDLEKLTPYASHAHIYHKGNMSKPDPRFRKWTVLPNVGREGHTYLHHIIENYDNLAPYIVFSQASQIWESFEYVKQHI